MRRTNVLVRLFTGGGLVLSSCARPEDATTSAGQALQIQDAGSNQGSSWAPIRKIEEPLVALAGKYPDFAGYYCAGGDLRVAVAAAVNEFEAQALAADIGASSVPRLCRSRATATHTPVVILEQREHTFLQLAIWRDRLSPSLFDIGATFVGIDYVANGIAVNVRTGSSGAVTSAVGAAAIPPSAVSVTESAPPMPASCATPSPSLGQTTYPLYDCFRPAVGGAKMTMEDNSFTMSYGWCTITIADILQGNRGFVTASHCLPPELVNAGDWITQPDFASYNLIASESVDPAGWTCGAYTCKYSDSSWMLQVSPDLGQKGAITQTLSWNGVVDYGGHPGSCNPVSLGAPCTLNIAHPRFPLYGSESPIQGMEVEKVGQNSGWTTGIINAACGDVTDNMGHLFVGNCPATNDAGSGDSGSPVFHLNLDEQDSAYLIGLAWGALNNTSLFFSPWSNVEQDLGTQDISYESQFEVLAGTAGAKPVTGDFNGDGKIDIALVGGSGWTTVPIAFGYGDGTFLLERVSSSFATYANTAGAKVVAVDVNNDGYTDLVAAGGSGWTSIPVALSNGFDTFQHHNFSVSNIANSTLAAQAQVSGAKLLAGDVNGDHKGDILIVGGSGSTGIWSGVSAGDGSFANIFSSSPTFASWASASGVTAVSCDLDHNGIVDVALAGGAGWTTIPVAFRAIDNSYAVTNDGVSNFPGWAQTTGAHLTCGDVNGDLRADLILSGGSSWASVPVALSNGDGTFAVTNNSAPAFAYDVQGEPAISGDFDNNGLADVAAVGVSTWWTVPIALTSSGGALTFSNRTAP